MKRLIITFTLVFAFMAMTAIAGPQAEAAKSFRADEWASSETFVFGQAMTNTSMVGVGVVELERSKVGPFASIGSDFDTAFQYAVGGVVRVYKGFYIYGGATFVDDSESGFDGTLAKGILFEVSERSDVLLGFGYDRLNKATFTFGAAF